MHISYFSIKISFFLWLVQNTDVFNTRFRLPVIPPSLNKQGPGNVLSPQQCLSMYLIPFPSISDARSHLFKAYRG